MHLDHMAWRRQPPIRSERARAAPLVWFPGADWFDMPWSGPTPHLHDQATEIGYLASGSLELEVGASTRTLSPGDFVIIPPDRHHSCRLVGDAIACLFIAVAPDHRHQRLRQQGFQSVNYDGGAPCANLAGDDPLPANEHFQADRVVVAAGAALPPAIDPLHERILYVVAGAAAVRIGPLAGTLATNRYAHIPAATPHELSNAGPDALVLLSLVVTAS